jgi:large subunit ribosomal protein L1
MVLYLKTPLRREFKRTMVIEKTKILEAIKKAREGKKRNFSQTFELIINLKDIEIKKEEEKIDEFVELPAGRGKSAKICAFVGPELKDAAKKTCDFYVLSEDFDSFDKRKIRKLARDYDFFIAQANIMPAVAKTFGRFLSPLGKMPSPKAGHIIPPKANIEPIVTMLKKSVKIIAKKAPVIQAIIGKDSMKDEEILQNALAIIDKLKSKLPKGEHNIKNILIKTTMGKPIKV